MAKKSKKKWYAVAAGRKIGVFSTWDECERQTKGHSRAKFKSFPTKEEAESFVARNREQSLKRSDDDTSAEEGPSAKRQRTDSPGGVEPPPPHTGRSSPGSTLTIGIHFDGGSRGNPGVAGAGAEVVVASDIICIKGGGDRRGTTSKVIHRIREYCGATSTNNVAEYTGLLVGLRCARVASTDFVRKVRADRSQEQQPAGGGSDGGGGLMTILVSVRGDSNLIICQMNGTNECRSGNLKPLYGECKSMVGDIKKLAVGTGFAALVNVTFEHVYRNDNKAADALANEAMDERRSWITTDTKKESGKACDHPSHPQAEAVIDLLSSQESDASRHEDV